MRIETNEFGMSGRILDDNGKELNIAVTKVEFEPIVPGQPVRAKLTVDDISISIACNCKDVKLIEVKD